MKEQPFANGLEAARSPLKRAKICSASLEAQW